MNNNIKTQLQQREFSALKEKHRVILKWATGCGKSKMAIDLVNYAAGGILHKPVSVLFLVAERAHIQNWEDEFSKWNLHRDKVSTDVVCYASMHKYKNFTYDIIVLDEGHHIFTEKRMAMLNEMPKSDNQYVFILSATLSSVKIDMAEEIFGKFTISTVTLRDAIQSDILPDPKVYVIDMGLDNKVPNQEIRMGNDPNAPTIRWEERNKYIFKNRPCIIKCTQYQKYLFYTNTMEYWKDRYEHSHNTFHHNKWVNMGSQRKRYLGDLKTSLVRDFIRRLRSRKRFVCFCSSVSQATELSRNNAISSKRPPKYNQAIIDAFNNREINQIFAVGMITEGMNLAAIEAGVIVQLDGKERLFVQKIGRVLRADSPVCYIFYYRNTQDEVYLKNALENIDEKYIQRIDINQLNTIKL